MKRLDLSLLSSVALLTLASPASAQMNMDMPGMSMPGMKMPPAKKPTAKKPASKKVISKRTSANTAKGRAKVAAPHQQTAAKSKLHHPGRDMTSMPGMAMPAGQDMSSMPGMAMPPGQDMKGMPGMPSTPGQEMSSMPGMAMPAGQDMKGMPGMATTPGQDMSSMPGMNAAASSDTEAIGTNLAAGNAPAPAVPTDHAADQVYSPAAMAMGLHHLQEFHGGQKFSQLLINIAEYHFNRGRDGYQWVGQGWYGGDINRLWFKSQGDGEIRRGVERAEVQGLFSHAIGPYFNLQGGVRYDFKPNPSRTYATVGVEGLAPGFFDIEAALFLSNKGELMGRFEGSYDQRITQRLILQPRVEINAAAQNSRSIGVGSGLSDVEAGLRLRYDIRREFAPYVGVQYKRAFGTTGRYLRDAGERTGGWSILAGIRTWF
jgi:copper resistance protein B